MSTMNSETPDQEHSTTTTHSFDDSDTRADEMREQLEAWVEDLAKLTDEAQASKQFQQWLDVQSKFHDYSARNTLLIKLQCPEATKVAGYNTWKDEFDRQVQAGEEAIWIWAPIITDKCPECGNSPSYHERTDCEFDETEPEEWSRGLVGFRPTSVFDISQTEGEPLPELETEAYGQTDGLVEALLEVTDVIGVDARIVPPGEWTHGSASGVCERRSPTTTKPVVEVVDRENRADLASTLIHEFAHALLHFDCDDEKERSRREVEAEAVAYIVSRHFGLDADNAAFYLAAWDGDAPETVRDRLDRISKTAAEVIDAVE
ncbi:ArdC-like ssDNA-binding domain-containing protein [Haloarcula salinisoli]|uniref:SsDNA-binding domain-containing protein n=1 Tax=Haloarcula salinisoli TaxID=2487746 RepID=A0A8J8CB18_9EURY|nr:ArdC-like ssDNA-binding domain-containing protein [Halomicroarcula salinisoli]MBX0305759.1 ssDNA-binding domain-containing protein [Halomicroarcula salinisoli]